MNERNSIFFQNFIKVLRICVMEMTLLFSEVSSQPLPKRNELFQLTKTAEQLNEFGDFWCLLLRSWKVVKRMRKRLLRLSSSAHMRTTPSVETSMMSLATVEQNLLFRSSTELKQNSQIRIHLFQPCKISPDHDTGFSLKTDCIYFVHSSKGKRKPKYLHFDAVVLLSFGFSVNAEVVKWCKCQIPEVPPDVLFFE